MRCSTIRDITIIGPDEILLIALGFAEAARAATHPIAHVRGGQAQPTYWTE
jgi:hypothetical protein